MSTDHLYTTKASYDVMKSRAEARCAALEEEILRERESRKQAEAALRKAINQLCPMCEAGFQVNKYPGGWFHETDHSVEYSWPYACRAALIRDLRIPIPQEPAERERGK